MALENTTISKNNVRALKVHKKTLRRTADPAGLALGQDPPLLGGATPLPLKPATRNDANAPDRA